MNPEGSFTMFASHIILLIEPHSEFLRFHSTYMQLNIICTSNILMKATYSNKLDNGFIL